MKAVEQYLQNEILIFFPWIWTWAIKRRLSAKPEKFDQGDWRVRNPFTPIGFFPVAFSPQSPRSVWSAVEKRHDKKKTVKLWEREWYTVVQMFGSGGAWNSGIVRMNAIVW